MSTQPTVTNSKMVQLLGLFILLSICAGLLIFCFTLRPCCFCSCKDKDNENFRIHTNSFAWLPFVVPSVMVLLICYMLGVMKMHIQVEAKVDLHPANMYLFFAVGLSSYWAAVVLYICGAFDNRAAS